MAKENKVEYERVDEEGDDYRRILVKFNPRFLLGSDFEIEFVPLFKAIPLGKVFVTEIDAMSTIDLYRWNCMIQCLASGSEKTERGTIISKGTSMATAEYLTDGWRRGEVRLEPRQIVARVKRVFEATAKTFSKETAYAYSHFLSRGELPSFPPATEAFTIKELKNVIEEMAYSGLNAEGRTVKRPLVDHLFDTHQTKYIRENICLFLKKICDIIEKIIEEEEKKV